MRNAPFRLWTVLIALNLASFLQVANAATISLATSPLANATASIVRPNIMYLLDNSGSMNWDYLPDYVSGGSGGTGSSICWNRINDSNSRSTCVSASDRSPPIFNTTDMEGSSVQVPFLSSDINYLYYNPATYYQPPFKADGSAYPNSTVTAAYTDGFAATGSVKLATTVTRKGTAILGSTNVTLDSTSGLAIGMQVAGGGIAPGTFLTTTSNPIILSKPTTGVLAGSTLGFTSGAYPHQAYCSSSSASAVQIYSAAGASSSVVVSIGTVSSSSSLVTGINTSNLFVGMTAAVAGGNTRTIEEITGLTTLTLSGSAGANGSKSLTFTPVCMETSDTSSDSNALYPSSTFGTAKGYAGVPYYYTMSPMQYCTDSTFASCQIAADSVYTVPAVYRWCNAYSTGTKTYSDCQDLRNATHTIPDYLGGYSTSTISAAQASANLTISTYVAGKSITGLTVNGTNIIGSDTFTAGTGTLTTSALIATTICTSIHNHSTSSGYDCTATSGAQLTIKANPPTGYSSYTTPNGYAVVVTGPAATTTTASTGVVTIAATGTVGTSKKLNSLTCGGTNTITTNTVTSGSSPASIDKVAGNSGSSGLEQKNATGWVFNCAPASDTPLKSVCTITGPAPGASCALVASIDGSANYTVTGNMAAGSLGTGPIATSPSAPVLSGGVNPLSFGRVRTGKFTRVDIVPSTSSYTKASGRTDCAGATCTYDDELQNFANWYSYYRNRLLLMKTTSTRAFNELDSKYRVGFDLLSHYSQPKKIDVEVAQFVDSGGEVANQRTTWWNNLTTATTSGSTPLRSSLMKMGKYYAGKLTNGVTTPAFGGVKAVGSLQINTGTRNNAQITIITINGVQMLDSTVTASCSTNCSSSQLNTFAGNVLSAITSSAAYSTSGYTASKSNSKITFTANAVGDGRNGEDIQAGTAGTIALAITDVGGGKNSTPVIPPAVIEPLQYSCQQNFTLLVTDGYWNSDSYDDLTQLDGTTVIGNQDNVNTGLTSRPAYDGAQSSVNCTDSSFSSCGTLADIAMYYYKTDLRDSSLGNQVSGDTGLDVSTNNVFKSATDTNQIQHMVLFTMGLGAPGTLRYTGNYATAASGDFKNIANGTANWPAVKQNDPTTIDDLWHAAINGRGKYFSARDPESVVKGLGEALASIEVREGAAAAAATSNLQPVAGDNFAYVASYTTNEWSGDLQARTINLLSGRVSDPANVAPNDCVSDIGCPWSAKKKLDAMDWNVRGVFMASSNGAALRAFTYSNLTATEKTYFDPGTGISAYGTGPLSQYGSVNASADSGQITANKLVDFLRGDRSLESGDPANKPEIWRQRAHILGDIVNTQPTFVRAPTATYQDSGYAAYVTAKANREGVVYVSGNDGMLHAIAAGDFADNTVTGGTELWSFIPTATLPYLRYLADKDYVHRYFVDGQITVSDVNFGGGAGDWHTILVGGLGGGGQAYYAIDITDPLNPKYLWEFTHASLGFTYGNASINKLPSGEWAVLFSSGYNNPGGKGFLYAVNPQTGTLKSGYPISTGSGTASSPSNLGKVAAWVDNLDANNTATQVYGGDMDGNLWRFDLTSQTAFKLAHLQDASGNPQPITTRPEMTLNDGARIVYVGTGRYLGDADPPDASVQSFYAFTDTLGAANLGGGAQVTWNPRTDTSAFLQRKLIALKDDGSLITRTNSSGNTVEARQICTGINSTVSSSTGKCTNETGGAMDWATKGGWYFDFPDTGERVNVDMNLTLGTLTIPSNVPASSACTSGGYGWVNYIDFKTGLEVDNSLIVSEKVANALIVGLNVVKIGDKLVAIITTSDFKHDATEPPGAPGKFKGKRDLWRELDLY